MPKKITRSYATTRTNGRPYKVAQPELTKVRQHDALLIADFELALEQERKSVNTTAMYVGAAKLLARWLATEDRPTLEAVRVYDLRAYVAWMQKTARTRQGKPFKPGYVHNQFNCLQQLYRFLVSQRFISTRSRREDPNPMALLTAPAPMPPEIPVIDSDLIIKLITNLRTEDTFEACRDLAIILALLTTGVRLEEVAQFTTEIDTRSRTISVTGKGEKPRLITLIPETYTAVRRYMMHRADHKQANLPNLWLAVNNRGPLTRNGIRQVIRRRSQSAGVKLHPHQFRHTFAHRFKLAGGQDSDLMTLMGWTSPQMLRRYGASAAQERASTTVQRLMPDILPELKAARHVR